MFKGSNDSKYFQVPHEEHCRQSNKTCIGDKYFLR
jgi:hypothetical protein